MNRSLLIKAFSIVVLAILLISAPLFLNSVYWVSVLILIGINILLASSLRTISLLDQISLGHVGFMLIGAYSSAILMMKIGLPFWTTLFLAGLLSGVIALALGYPFLRVRGVYFAMLTLLTAETFRLGAWNWRNLTGGSLGLINIPAPTRLGSISFEGVNNYYYLTLGVLTLSLLVLYRLERSPLGFTWRAIRDADNLAQSVGINVIWYRIVNFAVACFFAGIAGALFAHYRRGLSADLGSTFGVMTSLYLVIYMVVGGQRRFAGPIVGVFVLTLASELARPLKEFQPMLIGAIAILVVLFLPEGIVSLPQQFKLWPAALSKSVRKPEVKLSEHAEHQLRQVDVIGSLSRNSTEISQD